MIRLKSVSAAAAFLAAATFGMGARGQEMRRLPHPFGQMTTFSSDVDYQVPWHGRAMHRFLNEDLGLPISDSLWVASSTGANDVSALFRGTSTLSSQSSGVQRHSVFGLLVREWHRGNVDHFHSWTDDMLPQKRIMTLQPIAFSEDGSIEVAVSRANWFLNYRDTGEVRFRGYRQLRLLFDRDPPDDLRVELGFEDGTRRIYPQNLTKLFRTSPSAERSLPATITLFTQDGWPFGADAGTSKDPKEIISVFIKSDSCEKICDAKYIGLERDNFSKWSVDSQLNIVDRLNIRPSLVSSHGGLSYHPSFSGGGKYTRDLGFASSGPDLYRREAIGLASVFSSHAYHSDVLIRLGVRSVTSIIHGHASEQSPFAGKSPSPVGFYDGLYAASKTGVIFGETARPIQRIVEDLAQIEPTLGQIDLGPLLCQQSIYCRSFAQGSTIGAIARIDRQLMRANRTFEHHWYTHFGTTRFDPTYAASATEPFPPAAMEELRALALDYHDPGKTLPPHRRPWIPASGVWSNYRIMREALKGQIQVDPASSAVTIRSKIDPVLKQRLPDPASGARDLHGVTIYVPDAEKARIDLDGRPIRWFTRNPADETGRPSVTILDDWSPAILLGRLDPAETGKVTTAGGKAEWVASDDKELAPFLRLTAATVEARLTLAPHDVAIWNATHLGFSYRVRRQDGAVPQGRAVLVFVMKNGARIAIAEGAGRQPPAPADIGAWLAEAPRGEWRRVALAQHDFVWRPGADERAVLPLLVGQVERIEFELNRATPGDMLEVGEVTAFRPSSNGVAPDGSLLTGGQVLDRTGAPAPRIPIRMLREDGREIRTATDGSGYFFIREAMRGEIVTIETGSGSPCWPRRGKRIEITKNEAELDISLADCEGAASALN